MILLDDPAKECNGMLQCGPNSFCIPLPDDDECRCFEGYEGDAYDTQVGCTGNNTRKCHKILAYLSLVRENFYPSYYFLLNLLGTML